MKTFLLLTLCLVWMMMLEPTDPVAAIPFIIIIATLVFGTLTWVQVHCDQAFKQPPAKRPSEQQTRKQAIKKANRATQAKRSVNDE